MGTRADFYVGRGEKAEWIGSIAFDGYPEGIDGKLLGATGEKAFRARVLAFLDERDDSTLPDQGWPWPWEDSRTTDYAYAFDGGCVWATRGNCWFKADAEEPEAESASKERIVFPNMKSRQNVTFGKRSGLMVIGPGGPLDLP